MQLACFHSGKKHSGKCYGWEKIQENGFGFRMTVSPSLGADDQNYRIRFPILWIQVTFQSYEKILAHLY